VAKDSKYIAVFESPLPYFYLPITQNPPFLRVMQVRSSRPPQMVAAEVLREISALDPDMPVAEPKTMQQTMDGGLGFILFRVGAMQAGALGILGLIVASIGVYGVLSYSASQRARNRHQARARRESGRRAAADSAAGRDARADGDCDRPRRGHRRDAAISKFLMLATATEPLTFVAVTVLLLAIALLACYLPAWRAMRVDPMVSLRHDDGADETVPRRHRTTGRNCGREDDERRRCECGG
jgi:putative ABC transport system permease protein